MEFKDYYRTMGVSREASQDEIKRAYRKLARKYHPDVSKEKNAEERFKEIQEAYEVLRDPEKRAAYDKLGQRWRAGQEFRPPPDWDVGFDFGRAGFADGDFSEFSDFFESLFGGSRRRSASARERRQVRGRDEHARLVIDLEDAYRGATRTLNLRVPEITPEGEMRLRERNLNVRIPKGIMAGQRIRLAGQGGAGTRGGSSGDLYLEIEFRPHPLYHAEGRHIYLDLPVTPWEAALGATVVAPTLGGNVDMTIPKGSQAGRRLRLKGRGLPGNPPGDEYVVLRIVTPPATTASEEAAYRRMAKEFRFNPRANMGGR